MLPAHRSQAPARDRSASLSGHSSWLCLGKQLAGPWEVSALCWALAHPGAVPSPPGCGPVADSAFVHPVECPLCRTWQPPAPLWSSLLELASWNSGEGPGLAVTLVTWDQPGFPGGLRGLGVGVHPGEGKRERTVGPVGLETPSLATPSCGLSKMA